MNTSCVVAFMRTNPPTVGHVLVFKKVVELAKQEHADQMIFLSASQDQKKNPLSVDRKIYWAKKMYPAGNYRAAGGNMRTVIEVAKQLNHHGYKNFTLVAGSDRVPEFKKLLEKYNGTEFHFEHIDVVSAGERDPDAEGVTGISGSKMRQAAVENNFRLFASGTNLSAVEAHLMFDELRQAMGVNEELSFHQFRRKLQRM